MIISYEVKPLELLNVSEIYFVINHYSMDSVEIVSDCLKWIFEMRVDF